MNVTRTDKDKTTVELRIEILPEEMKPYIDKAVQRISKEVKVDGFRPGKVPYDLLKAKVGEMEIHQEATRDAVDDTLPKAIKREQLDFVGQPQINVEKVAPDNPFVYTVTIALLPTVDLKAYTKVSVKKEAVKIDEEKVKRTLDDLLKMRATNKPVERAAKTGDQVNVDFTVTLAGVPVEGGQGNNTPVTIGNNDFIPGFEEHLVDLKTDDKKEFTLTFPDNYPAKHLAGKECKFDVTVKSVNEVVLPEFNDEFAKSLQFETAKELENQIRQNVGRELEMKADRDFENSVIEAIINQSEFDPIPAIMVDDEISRMLSELKQDLQQQGAKFDDYLSHIKKTEAELRDSWKDQGEKRVKGALVLKAASERENVTVDEKEVEAEVEKYKNTYKDSPDELKQIDSFEFRSYSRSMIRNRKVVERLKDYASGKKPEAATPIAETDKK